MSAEDSGATWLDARVDEFPQEGEPRPFDEVLADAQGLDADSNPEAIDGLIKEAMALAPVQKRRVREAIKKGTGLPYGVMDEAERGAPEGDEADDLSLARGLADEIGRENVLANDAFVWRWRDTGVWQKQEDRSVKQWVQGYIPGKVDAVRKSNVESVADLFRTEVFSPHHEFDIGPPECVNCLNGELVLESGSWTLVPHDREHYRTTQIPIEHDPAETAPMFEKFMAEVFAGDSDTAEKRKALLGSR